MEMDDFGDWLIDFVILFISAFDLNSIFAQVKRVRKKLKQKTNYETTKV